MKFQERNLRGLTIEEIKARDAAAYEMAQSDLQTSERKQHKPSETPRFRSAFTGNSDTLQS